MPETLAPWITPTIVVAVLIYMHRSQRRAATQMEARLRQDMKELHGEVSDLRDRLGRIEGYLDLLRQFFLGSGRGTAA